jgi:hypothetical protein
MGRRISWENYYNNLGCSTFQKSHSCCRQVIRII